ncbi:hypothetical protein [Flammeovirga agarivorans]|uniref:Restriction endonuclease n=1 Tax=Flammeovirga agarivorans TaxID=2726742 RepID=A0A7X8XZA7_9BACT|nr:hypothetical protein [Flammeovirga agarivorans]NLR94982.1 hypothetical protein [Flammeovirga agarivorans]
MRDIKELESNGLKYWPSEIIEKEKKISILPHLLKTQDHFISILNISDSEPEAWLKVLKLNSSLSDNYFLKHLSILSDVGGEALQKLFGDFSDFFPNNKLQFNWNGSSHEYTFSSLKKRWSNKNVFIDGDGLSRDDISIESHPIVKDVAMFLIFGGLSTNTKLPEWVFEKCIIGSLIGKTEKLKQFVKERYIWVSRITGGAEANSLGNITEAYVKDFLIQELPNNWRVNKDKLPVSHNERTSLSVDIIVKSPSGNLCAIEVSFQVTTNSTIERKAGQAQSRQSLLHSKNCKIAYVIDGAGNFQRESALKSLCKYSDFTVTFAPNELNKLVTYLTENL